MHIKKTVLNLFCKLTRVLQSTWQGYGGAGVLHQCHCSHTPCALTLALKLTLFQQSTWHITCVCVCGGGTNDTFQGGVFLTSLQQSI